MKEAWEQEWVALRAEVAALQQQLQALAAQQASAKTPVRWRVPKGMQLVLLPVIVLLAAGGVLYGQGAMDALFIDKDGNVGIGTTTPSAKLEVSLGNPKVWSGNLRGLRLLSPDPNYALDVNAHVIEGGNVGYHFSPNNHLGLEITTPGNVGIGTMKPTAKLDVNGDMKATSIDVGGKANTEKQISLQLRSGNYADHYESNQLTFGFNGSDTYRHAIKTRHHSGQQAGNAIDFYVWKWDKDKVDATAIGGLHTMTLDGGNVGIGTPAPEQRVDIRSNGSRSAFTIDNALYLGNDNGTVRITNNAYPDKDGHWQIKDKQKKAFTLELRDSGMLELYGTVTNGIADWRKLATFDAANNKIDFPGNAPVTMAGNLTVGGDIWYQGYKFVLQAGAFAHAYNVEAASDQRLKKDIEPITNAAEKVRQLSAVTYHWNDDALRYFTRDIETTVSAGPHATAEENKKAWQAERDKRYKTLAATNVGVLAQEVEAVLPEAVSTDENGYKSVKYHYLTTLLIAAFKEKEKAAQAQARLVAQQQQEIARLTAATLTMQQQLAGLASQMKFAAHSE